MNRIIPCSHISNILNYVLTFKMSIKSKNLLKKDTKKGAAFIKTVLIDFWLSNNSPDLIVNEFPFFKGRRRADLIMISGNTLLGFEIKSELDVLTNLKEQIEDYKKVFDFVYIVLDKKFENNKELKKISKQIGILIYDKEIQIKRHSKQIKKFKKDNLITLLWRKDLEQIVNNKNISLENLRQRVKKQYTIKRIKEHISKSIKLRYNDKYQYFLLDRGNYTTIEDLKTITRIKSRNLFPSNINIVK